MSASRSARFASYVYHSFFFRVAFLSLPLAVASCSEPPCPPAPASDPPPQPVATPSDYVVPFIGSGGFGFRFGSAFPGAAAPHGLVKVGPDTKGPFGTVRFLHYSGYWYGDDTVQGFSHLHLHGTGASDYGVLTVMPLDRFSAARTQADGYGAALRKPSEQAAPGFYRVTLDPSGIDCELTATPHAAHHRYRYSSAVGQKALLFDLSHVIDSGEVTQAELHLDPEGRRIYGQLHSLGGMSRGYGGYDVYFSARTRSAWSSQKLWHDGSAPTAASDASGQQVGAVLLFDPAPTAEGPAGAAVELQLGLSLVSVDSAAKNLDAELPDWQFDASRSRTAETWEQRLAALRIFGGSDSERRSFYSALYRTFLMPSIHSDVDGRYRGFDQKVQLADGFHYVSDLSLWDSYRTLHPLYSLIAPADAKDSVRSLLAMAQTSGAFPKWPLAGGDSGTMIGAPAELVIADAYQKGVGPFDAEAAYQILRAAAADPSPPAGGRGGRSHVEDYQRLGYVPSYVGGSVSWTTEYARGDYALAQLAQALGHTAHAQQLGERAHSYRNLYDRSSGFLRPRAADGTFDWRAYDPTKYLDAYVEANGWQSLWMNGHDAEGLFALLGGREAAVAKLSQMFEQTQAEWEAFDRTAPQFGTEQPAYYWPGNEPDIDAAYLFALAGRPDLTQRWVRWLMDSQFPDRPDGLPGNDDGGTMSAWYVFSALGIYPIVGSDRYVLGAPRFPRIELSRSDGTFTIEAEGVSAERPYVQAVTLDGVALPLPELRHRELRGGRTLRFTMGPQPPATKG